MRLFTAIYPPPEIIAALVERIPPGFKHSPPDQWHITLGFHPEASAVRVEDFEDALGLIQLPPFEIRLSGTGKFGPVSWVGVAGDGLSELARLARRAATSSQISTDTKSYVPHLTLARDDGAVANAMYGWESEPWEVEEFRLIRSSLGGRVRHDVIGVWSLVD